MESVSATVAGRLGSGTTTRLSRPAARTWRGPTRTDSERLGPAKSIRIDSDRLGRTRTRPAAAALGGTGAADRTRMQPGRGPVRSGRGDVQPRAGSGVRGGDYLGNKVISCL